MYKLVSQAEMAELVELLRPALDRALSLTEAERSDEETLDIRLAAASLLYQALYNATSESMCAVLPDDAQLYATTVMWGMRTVGMASGALISQIGGAAQEHFAEGLERGLAAGDFATMPHEGQA